MVAKLPKAHHSRENSTVQGLKKLIKTEFSVKSLAAMDRTGRRGEVGDDRQLQWFTINTETDPSGRLPACRTLSTRNQRLSE